jgi:hypothetical protein
VNYSKVRTDEQTSHQQLLALASAAGGLLTVVGRARDMMRRFPECYGKINYYCKANGLVCRFDKKTHSRDADHFAMMQDSLKAQELVARAGGGCPPPSEYSFLPTTTLIQLEFLEACADPEYRDGPLVMDWGNYTHDQLTRALLLSNGHAGRPRSDESPGAAPRAEYAKQRAAAARLTRPPRQLETDLREPAHMHHVSRGQLRVVTVATQHHWLLPLVLRAAAKQGVELLVLGRDLNAPQQHGFKIHFLNETLSGMPDDDVVLFVDAYDVLLTQGSDAILSGFYSLGADVVFSAEARCHPDRERAPEYPRSATPYRFLNSGAFIGRVAALRWIIEHHTFEEDLTSSDQRFYSRIYLQHVRDHCGPTLTLDRHALIFQTVDERWPLDLSRSGGKWFNERTGNAPAVLHFPGAVNKFQVPLFYLLSFPDDAALLLVLLAAVALATLWLVGALPSCKVAVAAALSRSVVEMRRTASRTALRRLALDEWYKDHSV